MVCINIIIKDVDNNDNHDSHSNDYSNIILNMVLWTVPEFSGVWGDLGPQTFLDI